jgi:hypothetical protein
VKKSHRLKANNLMPNYEIVKKKKIHKKNPREKKMVTMVNLTNLLPEI